MGDLLHEVASAIPSDLWCIVAGYAISAEEIDSFMRSKCCTSLPDLVWLVRTQVDVSICQFKGCFYRAMKKACLPVVQYLCDENGLVKLTRAHVTSGNNTWMALLCASNELTLREIDYLPVIRYMCDPLGPVGLTRLDVRCNHDSLLRFATRSGQLPLIRYLFDPKGPIQLTRADLKPTRSAHMMPVENHMLQCAAEHGHLDLIRFLFDERGPIRLTTEDNGEALRRVAASGHPPVVQYLCAMMSHDDIRRSNSISCATPPVAAYLSYLMIYGQPPN